MVDYWVTRRWTAGRRGGGQRKWWSVTGSVRVVAASIIRHRTSVALSPSFASSSLASIAVVATPLDSLLSARVSRIFLIVSAAKMGIWDSFLNWLRSLFFKQEMELSLIGLQNAGKTSLVNSISTGGYSEDMIPTVGFNMRKVTKGNVTIKLWDLGGQQRFRTMWERYCRGVSAIIYVVDAADRDSIPIARSELHELLIKPSLSGIPLLLLGNKIDKSEALSKQAVVEQMGLELIKDREVCCYMISCKESINIDVVMDWLIKHSRTAR
ncbi:hypothetical protein KFK09_008969 [Dendrobium nobile]|uniref:Uncharacterized protein n=3 Tax=Dendrobium TaxID=37818 RepID=A0A8T3BMM7_DENNO|nr:hypothetical protein KFK09_008969 [Dendrobium nobile]